MDKVIKISGTIIPSDYQDVYDWFGCEATSPKKIANALLNVQPSDNLIVEINSPGGDVWSGSEIYTALKQITNNVFVKIMGVAASAASVIAMAGNKVAISPTAQIMIHNVSSGTCGDYREMQHMADMLENYNKSIANAYQLKTGMEQSKILEMMNQETWLTAQKAKELGFVDEIMFDGQMQLVASYGNMLPVEVVNKVKKIIVENKQKDLIALGKQRLSLLKFKEGII